MRLYDVTDCGWAQEKGQTSTLEQRGLELTIIDTLNHCSSELGELPEEYLTANYELAYEYLVYRDGEVHVLDGYHDVLFLCTPEFGDLYLSYAYKCPSGQAILVCFPTMEDAGNWENRILLTV